jgi:shikimate kinase
MMSGLLGQERKEAPMEGSERQVAFASRLDRKSLAQMLDRPVVLAGFMGVGKSSVGRLLADRLSLPFYDTDELIEEEVGMSVPELFASISEPAFRALEREVVARAVLRGRSVIALGGGALVDPDTRKLLLENALVIHLHLPWRELREILDSLRPGRPVLAGKSLEEVHDLYRGRLHAYREAHIRVTLRRTTAEEGMRQVLGVLESLASL